MATKKYLDYAGLKRVLAKLLPGARKIWHGTLAEWEALSAAEKAKYDQAEVIDEYTGVPVVVDKVESGNLNPVTSNAVARVNGPQYDTSHVQDITSIVSAAIQNRTPFTLPANCVLYMSYYAPIGVYMDIEVNNIAIASVAPPTDLTGVITLIGSSSDAACAFNFSQDTGFMCQKAVAVFKATN